MVEFPRFHFLYYLNCTIRNSSAEEQYITRLLTTQLAKKYLSMDRANEVSVLLPFHP